MQRSNLAIAQTLAETAQLLDLLEAGRFRVLAYYRTSDAVLSLPRPLGELLEQGLDPASLPGVGSETGNAAAQVARHGTCDLLEDLRWRVPGGLLDMRFVDGLGWRRIRALWRQLDISGPEDLAMAVRQGRVRELPGFGPKLERNLGQAVQTYLEGARPANVGEVEVLAAPLLDGLRSEPGVTEVLLAGDARRQRESVTGAVVVAAVAPDSPAPAVPSRLRNGLPARLITSAPRSFGSDLLRATGSDGHLTRLGRFAEHPSEIDVYADQGLPFIPPELRDDRGEMELARGNRLPRLVELPDIRGDLHSHTTFTDGRNALPDMAETARALGYAYLGITDHSVRPGEAIGLTERQLAGQRAAIDRLNRQYADQGHGFRLLAGCEVEILPDGSLNLPDDVLANLDYTICSVHAHFDLPRQEQTARLIRAMEHPACSILGHPTGRATGMFPAMDLDLEAVFAAAVRLGVILEIDSKPERLDLVAKHIRLAKSLGARFSISTDAHSVGGLAAMRLGIGQARRAWLEKEDVVNTLEVEELLRMMKR